MGETTWKCPGCGATLAIMQSSCPSCRISKIHAGPTQRSSASGEPQTRRMTAVKEVPLPCFILETRYSIVVPGGGAAVWTSGVTYVTAAGVYFLSDKDGFTTEEQAAQAAADASEKPKRIAPCSVFVPRASIKRLVHGAFAGNFLEIQDLKIPLRFSNDNWARFVGACRKLEIPVDG